MSGICFQRIWGWGGGLVGLQKTQVWPWVDDCWIAETGVWGPIGFLCICSLWQIFNSFLFCVLVIFKKTFIYWINLFGCIRSELWHLGSSVSIVAHGIFSCSPWGLVPWPGIEPGPPTLASNVQSQLNSRILIFCICHFWNSSPFLCLGWPPLLVSSVSNLHPDMKGQKWSFFQASLLSCAMEREVHFKQTLLPG